MNPEREPYRPIEQLEAELSAASDRLLTPEESCEVAVELGWDWSSHPVEYTEEIVNGFESISRLRLTAELKADLVSSLSDPKGTEIIRFGRTVRIPERRDAVDVERTIVKTLEQHLGRAPEEFVYLTNGSPGEREGEIELEIHLFANSHAITAESLLALTTTEAIARRITADADY